MTLLEVLDYVIRYTEGTEEAQSLRDRLAPCLLSRTYLLERAIAEAWQFFEHDIAEVCVDHAIEVAHNEEQLLLLRESAKTVTRPHHETMTIELAVLKTDTGEVLIATKRVAYDGGEITSPIAPATVETISRAISDWAAEHEAAKPLGRAFQALLDSRYPSAT